MFAIFKSLFGSFLDASPESSASMTQAPDAACVNPANGLPMVDGCGGVDVAGNPFGTDLSSSSTSGWGFFSTDRESSGSSSFDSFGSSGGFDGSGNDWG